MCVVVYAGDWVDKYALSLRKRKNDCVVLAPENSGLLAVDNAGCFVSILREDHFHVFMGKYGVRVHCGDTRYGCKGSSRKEMANYDVIDTVRCFPGDRHDGGVTVLLIGLPDVLVRQFSLRGQECRARRRPYQNRLILLQPASSDVLVCLWAVAFWAALVPGVRHRNLLMCYPLGVSVVYFWPFVALASAED